MCPFKNPKQVFLVATDISLIIDNSVIKSSTIPSTRNSPSLSLFKFSKGNYGIAVKTYNNYDDDEIGVLNMLKKKKINLACRNGYQI